MKDAYSAHADETSLDATDDRVRAAYLDAFDDLGLDVAVVPADDEVMGGRASAEFVAPVANGSDDLVACSSEGCRFGRTGESADFDAVSEGEDCPDCGGRLVECEGIEVGHVFKLGRRYAEALDWTVDAADGGRIHPTMGSYGFGVTRVIQTLLQQSAESRGVFGDGSERDDSGALDACRWPVTDWGTVAPYRAAVVPLDYGGEGGDGSRGSHADVADRLYRACGPEDVLLFDDSDQSIGERFAEADLLGIPVKVVVGNHYDETDEVELEDADGRTESLAPDDVADAVARFGASEE